MRLPSSGSVPLLFTEQLSRLQWPLYSFVRGIVGEEERARDLVQDVFVNAWRQAQQEAPPFTGETNEVGVRRWLFHDAYWRAISAVRRARIIRWESLDGDAGAEAERAYDVRRFEDQVVEGEVLRAALAQLPPDDPASVLLSPVP